MKNQTINKLLKLMKKNNGFTLVELLAVIVILAIIMVITIPTVLGNMNKAKQKSFNIVNETMKKYLIDNYQKCKLGNKDIFKYDNEIFNSDCTLNNANMQDLIENSGYNVKDIEKVDVTDDGRGNFGIYIYSNNNGKFSGIKQQLPNFIPNKPDLSNGLVPIKYNGTNWVVTTSTDPEWFDYSNQKWANAASLKEGTSKEPGTILQVPNGDETNEENINIYAMFVWVPRFSYTIGCTSGDSCLGYKVEGASDLTLATPGAIDINFASTNLKKDNDNNIILPQYIYNVDSNKMPTEDRMPENWYTHPAFTFENEELSGIWVGKFETSVDITSTCYKEVTNENCAALNSEVMPRILPNVISLRSQSLFNQYKTLEKFTLKPNNMYSLTGDSHIMKLSEWGAVAYLSQSQYGKYGNPLYSGENKEIYKNDSNSHYTGRSYGKLSDTGAQYSPTGLYKYDDIRILDGIKELNKGIGASTTGNIYGIYDMNGGTWEYLAANYNEKIKNSGFDSNIFTSNYKYFNIFTSAKPTVDNCELTLGLAFCETRGWYNDAIAEYNDENPWVARGGYYLNEKDSGIFSLDESGGGGGSERTFRTVLIK